MSCGCGGAPVSSAQKRKSLWRLAALVAIAWAITKREWGLLILGAAAFVAYCLSTHPRPATQAAAPQADVSPPDSFSSGTDNVPGSPSPTTLVQGISPTISGDC